MTPIYIFPYFISASKVSYRWSTDDVIQDTTNQTFDDFYEFISQYEKVICIDFFRAFKRATKTNIIDISYVKQIYKNEFQNFFNVNKDDTIIKSFRVNKAKETIKINAYSKIDTLFADKRLHTIPYALLFPNYIIDDFARSYINYMKLVDSKLLSSLDLSQNSFYEIFKKQLFIYNNLSESCTNECVIKNNMMNNVVKSIIKDTDNLQNKFIRTPIYNLFSSKTGRPYIIHGVNYQQLPINLKNVIKSQWHDGKLYEIDFNACEIRAALFCTGNYKLANLDDDIYNYFAKNVSKALNLNMNRKLIKRFIIPMLYGATKETLSKLIQHSQDDTNNIASILEEDFKLNKIKDSIRNDISKFGYFMNYFGRPIYTDNETHETTLVQNYIQSSAADICHAGYANLLSFVQDNDLKTKILYTKHDAIVIDVHAQEQNNLNNFMHAISDPGIENLYFKVKVGEIK